MKKAMWYVLLVSAFVVVFVISSCQVAPTSPGEDEIQPGATFSGSGDYLTPHDHTLIVKAVGDNLLGPYGVLANLDTTGGVTGAKVLEAALKVEAIPDSVKEKIKVVLKYAPAVEGGIENLPQDVREALNEVFAKMGSASSPEELKQVLLAIKESKKYNYINGMETGLELAIEIIDDGIGSIYSPDYEPGYAPHICTENRGGGYPQPDTGKDSTATDSTDSLWWVRFYDKLEEIHGDMVESDAEGAIEGAIIGALGSAELGGVIGGVLGGIVGGCASSTATFVVEFYKYLRYGE